MYGIHLNEFTLEEFSEILHSVDLLPGRRMLLDNLDRILFMLKDFNVATLADLQKALKKKSVYPSLAKRLSVSEDYLIVLNREINSYETKPLALDKIALFTEKEIRALTDIGIRTTKDLYEKGSKESGRQIIARTTKIAETRMTTALELTDLLRVNGIGPVFAHILNEIGIKGVADYLSLESDQILRRYQELNEWKSDSKAKLGLKDIEYCKRFCRKLDQDIEWR